MNLRLLPFLCLLLALGSLPALCAQDHPEPTFDLGTPRPLLAVYCSDTGEGGGPYLRVAIWKDGRVLFATDPRQWDDKLKEGRISLARIAELKKRIEKTGVFALKEKAYSVFDGEVDGIMVTDGARKQVLVWDEGDEAAPIKLRACWKALNRLALDSRPQKATPFKGRFVRSIRKP